MKNESPKTWYVYLAECADKSLYCGITDNIIKRFWQHNGMKKGGAKYTAARRPVSLLFFAETASKSLALKAEYAVKQLPKKQKLACLKQMQGQEKT